MSDPGLRAAGHTGRVVDLLRGADLDVATFDGVAENPSESEVHHGAEIAKSHRADGLIALGGGSAMDCAKGINFIATNGGRMADYKGHGRATKPMLPSLGVPTTSGTGSEAQSYALITDDSTHFKMACGDRKAAFAVALLDPELTLSQPAGVTAVTGIDAVAHAVEAFVCRKRNAVSDSFALAAWRQLAPNFAAVLRDPSDLEARAAMQLGAYLAGSAIENAMLGICHSCANPLTAHYGLTHGVAIGVMLPNVVRFNGPAANPSYAELLRAVGADPGPDPAAALADRLGELVRAAGLPTRLRDCGVSESILPVLAVEANAQWTARFNPREVGERELEAVYRAAW